MIQLPVPANRPLVVFTDLDGTLIDHNTYETGRSIDAIRKLTARRIPLVFCSSKTFAEQVFLQRQLDINQPFIFENGSAAAIPVGFFPEKLYHATRRENGYDIVVFAHADAAVLRSVLAPFETIKGYADASNVELSAATGLTHDALRRTRARWFTETLLTLLSEVEAGQLNILLQPAGFVLSRGGRFYTVQSALVNKGKAVKWMIDIFRQKSRQTLCFAAVGDSPNDAQMLEVVDVPFLVQRPGKSWLEVEIPDLIKIRGVGPEGFSMAVQQLVGV